MLLYNVSKIYLFDAQNKNIKEIKFFFNKIIIIKKFILIGIIIGIATSFFLIILFNILFKIFLS
jgi:hypothetical protein